MNTNTKRTLHFLADYFGENGFPPTIQEIKEFLGLKSVRGAVIQLEKLEKEGFIKREKGLSRGIKLLVSPNDDEEKIKLPLVGGIKAGIPALAQENIEEYIEIPLGKAKGRRDAFLLRVNGDSMVGKGIHSGDIAIIAPAQTAEDGETVVALVPDEETATLKTFKKLENYIALIHANPNYSPIIGRDFLIQGRLEGIIKKGSE